MNAAEVSVQRSLEALIFDFGSDIIDYLKVDDVTELLVNPDGKLFVDRLSMGRQNTGVRIPPEKRLAVISQVASLSNQSCSWENPSIAAELPDTKIFCSSRFQGQIPPCVAAPCFVIRKHPKQIFTLDDYVAQGVMSARQKDILLGAIKTRKNIIVAGGTRTGKTTFVNGLLAEISKESDRIVMIEDTPELRCSADDYVSMRVSDTRDMNFLLKDALRMSPDRLIIGEVRTGEALALLTAWNTGHDGGCSTVHANSAEATLTRLETMVSMASSSPQQSLIGEAVDMVIFLKLYGTKRKVEEIITVSGYNAELKKYDFSTIQ